jgi:hypothetical protein
MAEFEQAAVEAARPIADVVKGDKRMRSKLVFTTVFFLVFCISAYGVEVSAPQLSAQPGDTITVEISVDDATGIAAGDIKLVYDPAILAATEVRATALAAGLTVVSNIEVAGEVIVSMLSVTLTGLTGGAGALLEVDFEAIAEGESPLTLEEASFSDETAADIATTAVDGSVTVSLPKPADIDIARQETEKYKDVNVAIADGYDPGPEPECVSVPGVGSMGFHYVNQALVDDTFDPAHPEALMYSEEGELLGVEYIVISAEPVTGFDGEEFGPLPPEEFPENWLALHVWLYKENPAGLFATFNPDVTCPTVEEPPEEVLGFEGEHDPVWHLEATSPLLIGGYGDNFNYAGDMTVPYEGEAEVLLDAEQDTGTMVATFTGTINPEKDKTYTGEIKLVYNVTPTDGPAFWEGGVADFIFLHGDTGQGPPVMPKIRSFASAWGPADLYVDDQLIYEGLDGHMMFTERSRDVTTLAIYADDTRTSFYSPMEPSKGFIAAPDERELHFVAHSTVPDENNFPPDSVWIHLNFQDVTELPEPEEPTVDIETFDFVAHLSGEEAGVDTQAQGQATFHLSEDAMELSYRLAVGNLENVTMVHIHMAAPGQDGPPVVWLYPATPSPMLIEGRFDGVLAEGTITAAELVGPLAGEPLTALIEKMQTGETYVNVHTDQNPAGEIRGQIEKMGAPDVNTDIVNVPLFIADADGNTPAEPDALIFEGRMGNPLLAPDGHQLTLAEWNAVQGSAWVECIDEGTRVILQLTGLIPNGVYTGWSVTFKAPGFVTPTLEGLEENMIGLGALGKNDGSESAFIASATGEGFISAIVPPGPLSIIPGEIGGCALDEFEYHVVGTYHIDGQTYGADLGPDGTLAEQFAFVFKSGEVPEEPTEDFSHVFFMSLSPGLNMISLPLKPVTSYTARSFAEYISATVVIRYDETLRKFVGFTPAAPDDGFDIDGGRGYIANVPEGGAVAFTGAAWTNEPPVEFEAAPPISGSHSAWAFVVSGSVLDGDVMSAGDGDYTVTVRNLSTGAVATETVDISGYFAAAWADLTRKAVIGAGDKVEVAVMNGAGGIVSGPFVQDITLDEIRNAVVNVRLRLGDIMPERSALLQNYPNPFNPETWIPYHLRDAAPVSIRVYNASGQLIRTLELGHKDAGVYVSQWKAAYWDGKNEAGEEVASGTYFYSITAGDFFATGKMVVKK